MRRRAVPKVKFPRRRPIDPAQYISLRRRPKKKIDARLSGKVLHRLASGRGYRSKSEPGSNCSGLTKMLTATSPSAPAASRAIRIKSHMPRCSAPIVGTRTRRFLFSSTRRCAARDCGKDLHLSASSTLQPDRLPRITKTRDVGNLSSRRVARAHAIREMKMRARLRRARHYASSDRETAAAVRR